MAPKRVIRFSFSKYFPKNMKFGGYRGQPALRENVDDVKAVLFDQSRLHQVARLKMPVEL